MQLYVIRFYLILAGKSQYTHTQTCDMWHWRVLIVVTLVACLLPTCYCYSDTHFFITPFINDSSCQSEACFTLSQFANVRISTEDANITLIVLPGNHSLDTDLSLTDLTDLLVTPWYSHQAEPPKIFCSISARLYVERVSMVHVVGMELIGCQIINISSTEHFFFGMFVLITVQFSF